MKNKNKVTLHGILLVLGLITFILQVFVFQKPDGILGFIVCMASTLMIVVNIIMLCKVSKKFSATLRGVIESLFWL